MDTQSPQHPQHDSGSPEPNGQSNGPEQPQDADPKTALKAAVTGGVIVTVVGFLLMLLQNFYAADDPTKTYRDVADARARIVDYAAPRQVSEKTFTLFVPQDRRTTKRYEVSFDNFKGQPVLLVFWASWCQPCHKEMRVLDRIYDEMTDLGLHIVPIMTSDKSGIDGARYFFRGNDIEKLPLFLDHGTTLMREFQVRSMPQMYFINAEGQALGFSGDLDIGQDTAQDLLRYFAQSGNLPG